MNIKMIRSTQQDETAGKNVSLIARIKKRPFYFLVVVLFLVNIVLFATNAGLWVIAARQKLFVRADFTSFYTGYYMVRVGEGADLYDAAIQSKYQEQFMGGIIFEGGVLLFPNPPFVAVILSPISFLPLETAFYVWTVVQLALLVWILFSMNKLFSHWSKPERILLISTILAFWPLANTFILGQFSLFLVLGLVQMYIALKHSRMMRGGLWLALLAIKPHSLLIPGMMTLNKKYWRAAVVAVITGIFLFIFSSLFIGVQPWWQYIRNLLTMSTLYGKLGVNPNSEYTMRGLLSNILGNAQGNLTNTISIIFLIAGMVYVWFLWKKTTSPDNSNFKLYFAFTILLSVILSLHLNPHDALIAIFPAALFYEYLRENNYPSKAYSIILLISPLIFFIAAFTSFNLFGVMRPPILILFALLGWIVFYLINDGRRQHDTQPNRITAK